ncbi:MAG: hypothetical protein WC365_06925 [Candidatus Babeliales bacterium]|jgi:hypothetical protein
MATSGTATIPALASSVVVTHTYGSATFVVVWNAERDLGTVTITDKSTTQFTINITNVDFEADTSVAWAITTGIREADTAPAANQYCALANISAMPDVPGYQELNFTSQSDFEDYVSRLIDRASRHIDRYTRRPTAFFNGGATVTEYQNGNSSSLEGVYPDTARAGKLDIKNKVYRLSQSPIISVTSVNHNTAAIGEVEAWTAITAYHLDSETGELVFANTVAINEKSNYYAKNLRFIYVAGYASVPDEVEQACEELVANALKKAITDNLNARVRFGRPAAISMSGKEVFTDEIKEMLNPYQQVRL